MADSRFLASLPACAFQGSSTTGSCQHSWREVRVHLARGEGLGSWKTPNHGYCRGFLLCRPALGGQRVLFSEATTDPQPVLLARRWRKLAPERSLRDGTRKSTAFARIMLRR